MLMTKSKCVTNKQKFKANRQWEFEFQTNLFLANILSATMTSLELLSLCWILFQIQQGAQNAIHKAKPLNSTIQPTKILKIITEFL